jgi:hypothetical protein
VMKMLLQIALPRITKNRVGGFPLDGY